MIPRRGSAMTLWVEGGREGVKLEAQLPITESVEMFSSYPTEEDWL